LEAIEAGEMLEEEVPEVRMWRSFDPAAPAVTETDREDRLDVPDPWYGGPADFEACLATIEAATPHVVKHVSSQVA
ncbi:MAG: hypothetical protein FWG11_08380, partial [Promicromonosporaceae bacterium]|nr:hypothetical protein [Promicromonosporaceae bacterium]